MKFPLPADIFPSIRLSEDDTFAMMTLANELIHSAMVEYDQHRFQNDSIVDPKRYKLLKTRNNFSAYEDRFFKDTSETAGATAKMASVLSFGTAQGDLDDLMYGMIHPTEEMQRIRSSYTKDTVVDNRVFATLVSPTAEEPVRGVHLKWGLSDFAPFLLKTIVRPRDFVFLESTGIHVTDTGERIGYNLVHSMEVPLLRELHEYKIVRGKMSLCGLYRQKSSGVLELYMKGFVHPLGDVSASVAMAGTVEALLSYGSAIHCSQMKKLNWLLSKSKAPALTLPLPPECTVCHKDLSSGFKYMTKRTCRVCRGRVCSRCRVPKKLSFLSPQTRRIVVKSISFCSACVLKATTTNALDVARDEFVGENPYGAFELTSDITDSPASINTRSTSFDSMFGAFEVRSPVDSDAIVSMDDQSKSSKSSPDMSTSYDSMMNY